MVALPGFGDTPRYWARRVARAVGDEQPVLLDWPGLWGAPAATPDPVAELVELVRSFVAQATVVVAHSFGARVALHATTGRRPAGIVLLAPALHTPSFALGDAREAWIASSARPTTRPHPDTGLPVTFDIDVGFLHGLERLEPPCVPDAPTLVVCCSEDTRQNAMTRDLLGRQPGVTVVDVAAGHRFWEQADTLEAVCDTIENWMWR